MPVNGSAQDAISIDDRGLAYGDGVFETIRIHGRTPVLYARHIDRILKGAQALKIPLDRDQLEQEIDNLHPDFPDKGVLKIIVTRGSGGRGYRPSSGEECTRILSLHPMPDYNGDPEHGVDVFVCDQRLSRQPALAGIKHLNRLEQVLASLEWPEGNYMEGLMLDMDDNVIEGTRSNIFWAEEGRLMTPVIESCGVEGVMRNYLLDKLPEIAQEAESPLERLYHADEIFLCNSVFGIWPVNRIQSADLGIDIVEEDTFGKYAALAQTLFYELLTYHGD